MSETKSKMGRPPPKWLFKLKSGEYGSEYLKNTSGKSRQNVSYLMRKYAYKITYKVDEAGKSKAIYDWDSDEFLRLFSL